ncbi:uncharacterized protein [Epargyreus clarus]|uniref:uncharacterized protein n=1 Tax=Epargyreus clarus TaxID=520877 RepID=UPI003C2AC349
MPDEFSIDNELLISLVEQRPVLWDKTMDLYKNRAATRQAWKEIMMTLNPDFETKKEKIRQAHTKLAIQRWTHIRDNYNRSHKKRQDQKRSGIGGKRVKPYVYSKQLSFLQKVIQLRQSISSLISDDSNTESENPVNNSEDIEILEVNSLQTNDRVSMNSIPKKRQQNDVNHPDAKMMKFVDSSSYNEPRSINRHLSFFNGILPSLENFDEDDVLEFQMGVLQLVKKIKSSQQNRESSSFSLKYDNPLI